MKGNEKIIIFGIGIIVIFVLLKTIIQFTLWEYPKNCIFFELDFSKECVSYNWEYTLEKNKKSMGATITGGFESYVEWKQKKLERSLERLQNNLENLETSSGGLDITE